MAGDWIASLAPPFVLGLALSWALEALLKPRPVAPWRRPRAAIAIHTGVWTILFGLELALFRRPYFAVANVLAIQAVLVLVSNSKFRSLKEPFVYPDFEYFSDAMRHPRLYLPFLGLANAFLLAACYGAVLWLGLTFEVSLVLDPGARLGPFYAGAFSLAAAGLLLAYFAGQHRAAVTFDAGADLHRFGLVACLWWYGSSERQSSTDILKQAPFGGVSTSQQARQPDRDIVCIQSESFFDIRRYCGAVKESVLENFDRLRAESVAHGQLKVPAWGANTVRTEFAFLSGLPAASLGVHRYNPYRRLAMQGVPTLASHLRDKGYRTVCVHPYHASFYRRNEILPQLGFDEFITLEAFQNAPLFGPYVSDAAVVEYVVQRLNAAGNDAPLFVFVITMENHGPLHWERITAEDANRVLGSPVPPESEDLVAYARHLCNADHSFARLANALRVRPRAGTLCIYGDHVPIMSKVYATMGEPDGMTDYLIWRSDSSGSGARCDASVENLAHLLVDGAQSS